MRNSPYGCLIAFGFLFALVALGILVAMVVAVLSGEEVSMETAIGVGAFCVVAVGAGLGFAYAGFTTRNKVRQRQKVKERYLDQPWMQKEDWRRGYVKSSKKKEALPCAELLCSGTRSAPRPSLRYPMS